MKNNSKMVSGDYFFDLEADCEIVGSALGYDERIQLLRLILTEPDPHTYLVKPAYIPKMDVVNTTYEKAVSELDRAKHSKEAIDAFLEKMDQLLKDWGVPNKWYYKDHPDVIKTFIDAIRRDFGADVTSITLNRYYVKRVECNQSKRKGIRGRKRTIYSNAVSARYYESREFRYSVQYGSGLARFLNNWVKAVIKPDVKEGAPNDNDAVPQTPEGQEQTSGASTNG